MPPFTLERLKLARWDAATDRHVFSAPAMVLFSIGGACLTGLSAMIRVHLPFTPVPVTGQVLAVLLAAPSWRGYGLLSQVLHVALARRAYRGSRAARPAWPGSSGRPAVTCSVS